MPPWIKKTLWWLFLAWLPTWVAAAAICLASAQYHGPLIPDASTGHIYPLLVGQKGGPYHTYYVTYVYFLSWNIAQAVFWVCLFAGFLFVVTGSVFALRSRIARSKGTIATIQKGPAP